MDKQRVYRCLSGTIYRQGCKYYIEILDQTDQGHQALVMVNDIIDWQYFDLIDFIFYSHTQNGVLG
jgi:hypothetical protein